MHLSSRTIVRSIVAATACCSIVIQEPPKAMAATLSSGWNYGIDSFTDGVSGFQVGGNQFEFYGIGIKQTVDRTFIAINANLPLAGSPNAVVQGGSISYGDLFFNFSGQNFKNASDVASLFAIRFAESNDSPVATGVYSNVTAKSTTATNDGFSTLSQYNTRVQSGRGTPSIGSLAATDPYFEQNGPVLNSIAKGTKVGEISFLNSAALSAIGLDFGQFNAVGSQTIGFSFDKSAMPSGNYVANLFAECANDAIAITGEFEAVPEPSTIFGTLVGLSFLGIGAAKRKIKHKIA